MKTQNTPQFYAEERLDTNYFIVKKSIEHSSIDEDDENPEQRRGGGGGLRRSRLRGDHVSLVER